MKILLACSLTLAAGRGQTRSVSAPSAADIPHLRKQGTATQLIVDGKPFLALAGELSNSTATSIEYMKAVWPRLAAAKVNTVSCLSSRSTKQGHHERYAAV